jgi:hypothetical protein
VSIVFYVLLQDGIGDPITLLFDDELQKDDPGVHPTDLQNTCTSPSKVRIADTDFVQKYQLRV